jgi:hypothetical protein
MASSSHAKPIPECLDEALAHLSDIKSRVGYCCPRGTTGTPRDGGSVTGAVPVVPAL